MQRIKSGAQDGLHNIFHHPAHLAYWRAGKIVPPLWVEIGSTDLCNQKCFYCYPRKKMHRGNFIPKDLLLRIIYGLAANEVRCCEFQGAGEPLLNEATTDAIVVGKHEGMDMCLVTNGVLLTEETLHKIEPYLSYLRVSSLAHNAKYYDMLHKSGTDDYNIVINALKNAVRIRDTEKLETVIVTTFILFDFNIPYIIETAKMMKDIGVNVFTVKPFVTLDPSFKRQLFHLEYLDKFEETKELEDDNFKVCLNEGQISTYMSEEHPRNYDKCYGVAFETYINEEAKVYPCTYYRNQEAYCFGDLKESDFKAIWWGHKKLSILKEFYNKGNLKDCSKFCCKQHSINGILYEMANPPRHKDVL